MAHKTKRLSKKNIESKEAVYPPTADKVVEHNKVVGHNYYLTSSLRTPRNINHPFFLGNNA